MKKRSLIILLSIFMLLAIIFMAIRLFSGPEDSWICENSQWVRHGNPSSPMPTSGCGNKLIGGEKDEHGCLGSAGYSWCPSTKKCQRMWEEYCEEHKDVYKGNEKIQVSSPESGSVITSPVKITGQARGGWYSEANFPIKIKDEKENVLGQGLAQAQSDWMTEDFVPFKAAINFDPKENEKGFIILEKDNPSGLPENADSINIPVRFKSGT
jgi:hypothetical protein